MGKRNYHLKKNPKSQRGSFTLISIHGESDMNTYQGKEEADGADGGRNH